MSLRWSVALVAVALVACRTSPFELPTEESAPADLAVGGTTTARPGDLAAVPLGCHSLSRCVSRCSDTACKMACASAATQHAQDLLQPAMNCFEKDCVAARRCAIDATGQPVDPMGTQSGSCSRCMDDVGSRLFGISCMPPDDPVCSDRTCSQPAQACADDLP
jgi:hypothetical protein